MQARQVDALTGLRGVAAVLVAAYHFYPPDQIAAAPLRHAAAHGYMWVDLFFVLSGYVMALNYGRMFAQDASAAAFADFLVRRVARIYPLYLALLLARLAYTWAAFGRLDGPETWFAVQLHHPVREILANVFLVQSWGLATSINGPAWSVSAEWGAYFLFPLLTAGALFGARRVAWLCGLGALALVVAVAALDASDGAFHSGALDAYDGRTLAPLLRCVGGFTLGLLTWRIETHPACARLAGRDLVGWAVLALLAAALIADAPDLASYALLPPLVLCLAANRGSLARCFACKPVLRLGVLSYAIYLLHVFLIAPLRWLEVSLGGALPPLAGKAIAGLAVAALLVGLAELACRFIERPGRALVRGLHWRPASAPASALPPAPALRQVPR